MHNTEAKTNRIYLFDNIKFVAILLVVIGHAIDFLTDSGGNMLEKSLFITIYSIHMPLFIFISGLFLKPMDKSTSFPKKKVISYILIGIVLRMMMSVLRLLVGRSMKYSLLDMYDTFTWFMWAMAIFITLMWIFREHNTKIILFLSLLVGCMAGYDKFIGDKFVVMRILVFLPFFVAGYMIKPAQLVDLLSKKWLKIVAIFVVIGFTAFFFLQTDVYKYLRPMFTGRNSFVVLKQYKNYGGLVRLFCYAFSAVFGLSLMSLVPNRSLGIISKTGTKTLQIYFWHEVFILFLSYFGVYDLISSVTGDTVATAVYLLFATAITFVCSLPVFSFPTKQLLRF